MPQHQLLLRVRDVALFFMTGVAAASALPLPVNASSLRRTAEVTAIEQARPSVVNIHGRKTIAAELPDQTKGDGVQQVNGMGTGIVVDERGYIVTNYHVVEGVARIQVTTAVGKTVLADLVAHDGKTDLAIIKIETEEPMPVIRIGTSQDLMTGEPVLAIGNAYGYTHTVTRGIISALHRPIEVSETQTYPDLIQTDASINPGNSGGPLLNIDGDMIGINVAVRMGAQGIGFALPVDEAMEVVARLMDEEVCRRLDHGVMGKSTLNAAGGSFVVTAVTAGSGAETCGLRPGDVIVSADNKPVLRALDYERVLLAHQAGDEVQLRVTRSGVDMNLSLVLGEAVVTPVSVSDQAWEILGLRLSPAPAQSVRQQSTRYRGGLRVAGVRAGGPAARQGIRTGDILVGLHKWETVSLDNISYILDNDEFVQAQPAKFYILRGGETLYGQLRVSLR
jgi:serine protease Do